MKINKILTLFAILAVTFNACKKDSDLPKLPEPVNEPEVITSVKLTFKDSANTANVISFEFKDPDGEGGNQPTRFDTIKLKSNTTYLVNIELYNDILKEDITSEIEEEKNEHLFVYKPQGANVSISITDSDTNTPPLPVGITSKWKTGAISSGKVNVILKHQPGTKNGTEAPGETDVDLNFETRITN
jgi:hypothetical protein